MNLLEQGSNWLEKKRHDYLSSPVNFVRGGESIPVNATLGRTEFDVSVDMGITEKYETRDFLVRREDLVILGERVNPKRGDRFHYHIEGQVFIYEVMAPGKEPVYRESDLFKKTLRIHTKLIEVQDE